MLASELQIIFSVLHSLRFSSEIQAAGSVVLKSSCGVEEGWTQLWLWSQGEFCPKMQTCTSAAPFAHMQRFGRRWHCNAIFWVPRKRLTVYLGTTVVSRCPCSIVPCRREAIPVPSAIWPPIILTVQNWFKQGKKMNCQLISIAFPAFCWALCKSFV